MIRNPNKILYQDEHVTKFELRSKKYGNKECFIDTKDWKRVERYYWFLYKKSDEKCFYAIAHIKKNNKWNTLKLHRFILNLKNKKEIDHKDLNGLNNTKLNLRICTHAENMRNRRINFDNKSGCKGVCPVINSKKWRIQIVVNGKNIYLGQCENPEDGAKIYDKAALKYHGEFANINGVVL
jgi:hypothetical protein